MQLHPPLALLSSAPPIPSRSLAEMLLGGGPLMLPIGLASVVALAYIVERGARLRRSQLGTPRQARELVESVREGGAAGGLAHCARAARPLTRIIAASLERSGESRAAMERAAEEAGQREIARLASGLRPLVVVAMIAPLLGLLGTVWGMIQAFASIGQQGALGRPELLAASISQALVTTAAGLAIAIPSQAAYYFFKSRIERFARLAEDVQQDVLHSLAQRERSAA